jgi:hypothetical protein
VVDSARTRPWYTPMRARGVDEPHRASTPLELLFDLCFVVAVAQDAAKLHHAVSESHVGHGSGNTAPVRTKALANRCSVADIPGWHEGDAPGCCLQQPSTLLDGGSLPHFLQKYRV